MNKTQRITPQAIIEIQRDNKFYYGQILKSKNCAFFDIQSDKPLSDLSVLNDKPILFIVAVYNDAIAKGRWTKVGKLPIRDELLVEPFKFIQDSLNPDNVELYNPMTGQIIPSNREEATGLECAAVWEAEHVEDRLIDFYQDKPNEWVEQLALK